MEKWRDQSYRILLARRRYWGKAIPKLTYEVTRTKEKLGRWEKKYFSFSLLNVFVAWNRKNANTCKPNSLLSLSMSVFKLEKLSFILSWYRWESYLKKHREENHLKVILCHACLFSLHVYMAELFILQSTSIRAWEMCNVGTVYYRPSPKLSWASLPLPRKSIPCWGERLKEMLVFFELLWVRTICCFLKKKDFSLHVEILLPLYIIITKLLEKETFSFFSTVVFRRKDDFLFSKLQFVFFSWHNISQYCYSASPQTWQDWCNLSEIMAYWKIFQCSQSWSRVTEMGRKLCKKPSLPLWSKAGSTSLQQFLRELIKPFV